MMDLGRLRAREVLLGETHAATEARGERSARAWLWDLLNHPLRTLNASDTAEG
jgi:hypothetical protein